MSSLFSLCKIELCSSLDNIFLMLNVILKHIKNVENLWLIVNKCKHVNTKCILKLCMLIEIVEEKICIYICSEFYNYSHTFT